MKKYVLIPSVAFVLISSIFQPAIAQPSNNPCNNAISLIVNAPCTNGNNNGATLDGPAAQGCWASVPNQDVWYTFTTIAAGIYTVTTDNGINTDMQLKVYS